MAQKKSQTGHAVKRMELRIDPELYEMFTHFAQVNHLTRNQAMQDAMRHYMNWVNHNYDLPTAETERLNELVASQEQLRDQIYALTRQLRYGFESLLQVMHGSAYLESDQPSTWQPPKASDDH